MKRTISALLCLFIMLSFAGCGKKAKRELYNENLSKYITIGEYKGLKVDKSSDSYKAYYDGTVNADISDNGFYNEIKEGTVADGDTVNIDYEGKKDGVAFQGGTAQAQDLTIGSKKFIDGFEDGLKGVKIGDTVTLNLKFPDNYNNASLAGQAVVFTVKVNYVKEPQKPADYYAKLNFKSEDDYIKDVTERAVKSYLVNTFLNNLKVSDYPAEDCEKIYRFYRNTTEKNVKSQYGVEFSEYLTANSMTEDTFKQTMLKNAVQPFMEEQMAFYSVIDGEKIKITDADKNEQIKKMLKEVDEGITEDDIKEAYDDFYFEYLAVKEKAENILYENAVIQ